MPLRSFQIVYAVGMQTALPSREQRVAAAQALLRVASRMADTPSSVLSKPGVAVWKHAQSRWGSKGKGRLNYFYGCICISWSRRIHSKMHSPRGSTRHLVVAPSLFRSNMPCRKPGGFAGVRLLPGHALEAVVEEVCAQLARGLLDDPPYELRWMLGHPQHHKVWLKWGGGLVADVSWWPMWAGG